MFIRQQLRKTEKKSEQPKYYALRNGLIIRKLKIQVNEELVEKDGKIREDLGAGSSEGDTKVVGLNGQSTRIDENDKELSAPTAHQARNITNRKIFDTSEQKTVSEKEQASGLSGIKIN